MEKIAQNYSIQLLLTVYQSPTSAFMIFKSLPLPQKNRISTIETLCAGVGRGSVTEMGLALGGDADQGLKGLMAPPQRRTKCPSTTTMSRQGTLNSSPLTQFEAHTHLTHPYTYTHSPTSLPQETAGQEFWRCNSIKIKLDGKS